MKGPAPPTAGSPDNNNNNAASTSAEPQRHHSQKQHHQQHQDDIPSFATLLARSNPRYRPNAVVLQPDRQALPLSGPQQQTNSDSGQPASQQQQQQQPQQQRQQLQYQQPHLQHHHCQYTNGSSSPSTMQGNGGAGGPATGMPVGPTPAGHQAELNLIYGMVEELSRQLSDNRRVTEDIVSGLGRVRNRARERSQANEEILGEASADLLSQELNLDQLVSVLTEALDRAKLSRDSNFSLLTHYARVLSNILGQFHAYKQQHVSDVSAWHRSYRQQLAEARAENERLREQMWDMQEHAGRANDLLRQVRKTYDEDTERWKHRIEDHSARQEIRFWKRMAMPDIPDDSAEYWSDDDDLVDPVEKERLREVERKVAEQVRQGLGSPTSQQSDESEGEMNHSGSGFGGVAMERDNSMSGSSSGGMPNPPPRPSSTGSTQGRAG